jgi:hypothetical protein
VVLPELWAVGYFAFDAYAREAELTSGPYTPLRAADPYLGPAAREVPR